MDEYIRKADAFDVLTDYYHHTTQVQHMALKEALDRVPTSSYPVSAYEIVDFWEFLCNTINPNDMERYLEMWHNRMDAQDRV